MGTVTTAMDTAVAVTITDGTEAAATTNGATIAVGKAFAVFAFVIPLPGRYANAATRTVAPCGAAGSANPRSLKKPKPGDACQPGRFASDALAGVQPSPISTAIRIRSE